MDPLRRITDRLRDEVLVRTNSLGATTRYPIGANVTDDDGVRWRITRHKTWATVPWETVVVYAVRVG